MSPRVSFVKGLRRAWRASSPRRRAVLASAALIAAANLGGVAPALAETTRVRFALDWVVQGQHAPFVYALTKGYYKAEGLDVSVDAGGGSSVTIQRVASGAYDMGFADLSLLVEAMANNTDVPGVQVIYQVYERDPNVLFAVRSRGIHDVADLRGKKIGGGNYSAVRRQWAIFARAAKIDPGAVNWISVAPNVMESLVVKGELDVGSGLPTQAQIYEQMGIKHDDLIAIRYADYGVNFYSNAILANTAFLKRSPAAAAAFLRAFNHSLKDTLADPATTVKAVLAQAPTLVESEELAKLNLMLPYVDTPNSRIDGLGAVRPATLEKQLDDMLTSYELKRRPAASEIFNAAFLPPQAERMVKQSTVQPPLR